MQLNDVLALLIATLIGLLPNLLIKMVERSKTKQEAEQAEQVAKKTREEVNKTSLESADLAQDILQSALKFSQDQIIFLRDELRHEKNLSHLKDEKIDVLEKYIISYHKEKTECQLDDPIYDSFLSAKGAKIIPEEGK